MKYRNPKPPLDRLLAGPSEEASVELHKLYLAAIESRMDSEEAESRLIARAVIGAAPHHALCDEAIAAFTGLQLSIVSSWVDDLSSLLYRDHTIQGGIRARHISIFEYFTGRPDYSNMGCSDRNTDWGTEAGRQHHCDANEGRPPASP
ncbi:hypothetical protein M408DRAFT_226713 [Serendipita vermifera MAFF 305830]|uniref:Uncharacterized protein n=1 Tax=Serendipita vermifera MAFF 305830 TaxID=933852 RepID=A0A0C3AJD1_SERVB|nr:hypothetical protein M408DRAFT_226713 [Serendipita vermifera MAFF 305830]